MANSEAIRRGIDAAPGAYVLRPGTLAAAAVAVCVAQVALAIPAVLNGLFQQDLGTTSSPAHLDLRRLPGPGHAC